MKESNIEKLIEKGEKHKEIAPVVNDNLNTFRQELEELEVSENKLYTDFSGSLMFNKHDSENLNPLKSKSLSLKRVINNSLVDEYAPTFGDKISCFLEDLSSNLPINSVTKNLLSNPEFKERFEACEEKYSLIGEYSNSFYSFNNTFSTRVIHSKPFVLIPDNKLLEDVYKFEEDYKKSSTFKEKIPIR